MAADVLTLGGVTFGNFSTPTGMGAGGAQAMVVHKLPGGSRVIDTLGPDEANITWSGFFFGNNAYTDVLAIDALRAAGQVLSLTWAGQFRSVLIDNFTYHIRRLPMWVEYSISCTVSQNPMQGASPTLPTSSIDDLVSTDLSTASAAAASNVSAEAAGL
jgi:hypothetical protein